MAVKWTLFIVFLQLSFATHTDTLTHEHNEGHSKSKVLTMDGQLNSASTLWFPSLSLKEYHSFKDAKVFVLNTPAYTSEMHLTFMFHGNYAKSKEPCNKTITVLLQHGSPAVPHRDDIGSDTWLSNNTQGTFKTLISLGNYKRKRIPSPLPGYWYVTTYLVYEKKVKKIKEKGLSTPDDRCLCATKIYQTLETPSQTAVVISKGQKLTNIGNPRQDTVRYYQYFVSEYSKNFSVILSVRCLSKIQNCSLRLSVSAKSLPSGSTSCRVNYTNTCKVTVEWPQPKTNYYIEVNGTSSSFDITANHTDCQQTTSSCYPIIKLSNAVQFFFSSVWQGGSRSYNVTPLFFSVEVEPNYVGATLTFALIHLSKSYNTTYKMCIRKDTPPFDILNSTVLFHEYCSTKNNSDVYMKVLFPQPGRWYIGVSVRSKNITFIPNFTFRAGMQSCLDPYCSGHGSCLVYSDIGVSYGVCVCHYGYSGWTCADYHGINILAICLLTISNIAFLPAIIVACKRRFYPEAIVYLFNMYCSTAYHACDSHGYCIYGYNPLQLSDFFASVLSVWFTLMVILKLPSVWHRTINILGLLGLFIGVQLARFGITIIVVPAGVGTGLVLISFGLRSYYRRKYYPSCKRWLFYLLPAAVLTIVAITIYVSLETTANYMYLHSIWHICIALSIPLLLPTVRKPTVFREYNMIRQLNDGEEFHDSDESLLLNAWNPGDRDNETENDLERARLPQLVT